MPQLNGGGGDDLGANDEMIAFKDEGDNEEKIRESSFTESDLADLKSSLVNESEISQNSNSAVRPRQQRIQVCVCVCVCRCCECVVVCVCNS